MLHNFTYIQQNLVEWSMQGYIYALGFLAWPLIFSGVVGYVYLKQQSAVAAVVAVLIIFAAFGNAFVGVDIFVSLMYIITALVMTALLLVFLSRRR